MARTSFSAAGIPRYRAFRDADYNINSLAKTTRVRNQVGRGDIEGTNCVVCEWDNGEHAEPGS